LIGFASRLSPPPWHCRNSVEWRSAKSPALWRVVTTLRRSLSVPGMVAVVRPCASQCVSSRQPAFLALESMPFHRQERMRLNQFYARCMPALWAANGRGGEGWGQSRKIGLHLLPHLSERDRSSAPSKVHAGRSLHAMVPASMYLFLHYGPMNAELNDCPCDAI
jgi:hypothetical protein